MQTYRGSMMGFFDFEFKIGDIKKHQPPLQKLNVSFKLKIEY